MISSLGPVLAIPLITDNTIKLYSRFVVDTLLVMKPENVSQILNILSKFGRTLRYTVGIF